MMVRQFVARASLALVALLLFGGSTVVGAQSAPLTVQAAAVAGQAQTTGPVRRLSVDDAVALALEGNLSIQVERINPQIRDLAIAEANAAWGPTATASLDNNSQTSPPDSLFAGADNKVTNDTFQTTLGVNQRLPWRGGNYSLSWNTSRRSTNNVFTNFQPIVRSFLDFQFTQPLLQGYRIDQQRQQVLVSKKNREISDIQFRTTVVSTIRSVKSAYWDLVYAYSNLDVQNQSLELARRTLKDNQVRVEVGTMAPIDIVEAEAEVARNEETVIVAEAQIRTSEDRLRALVFDPKMADFWTVRLEPTDRPAPPTAPVDVDAAVRAALDKRTDLLQAKKSLETTDLTLKFQHNLTLPQLNFNVNYQAEGLGGTELQRNFGFPPGPVIGTIDRSLAGILGDVLRSQYPDWVFGLSLSYPVGYSQAKATMARTRLEQTQAQAQLRTIELNIGTQVRDSGRQVNTNMRRLSATLAARQLAEKRLEAEQRKFAVGTSTSFQVFQAQRDLASARNNELRAVLDYNKSLVDFEAVQETSVGSASTGLVVSSSSSATGGGTAASTTTTLPQTGAGIAAR